MNIYYILKTIALSYIYTCISIFIMVRNFEYKRKLVRTYINEDVGNGCFNVRMRYTYILKCNCFQYNKIIFTSTFYEIIT